MRRPRSWTQLLRAVGAASVVAMVAAGCGGANKPTDQQQIEQVLHSYLSAQATGDGQAACALLSPSGQSELITLVMTQAKGLVTTRPSCQDAVGLIRTFAGQSLMSALQNATIRQVQVAGSTGSAEVIVATQAAQRVTLEKSGTAWKISGVPGLAG